MDELFVVGDLSFMRLRVLASDIIESSPEAGMQPANLPLAAVADESLQRSTLSAAALDLQERHMIGKCNPCLFALRTTCRRHPSCSYCHLPGHRKPKRARKHARDSKKNRIGRTTTPSLERCSGENASIASLPCVALPSSPVPRVSLATAFYQNGAPQYVVCYPVSATTVAFY